MLSSYYIANWKDRQADSQTDRQRQVLRGCASKKNPDLKFNS